MRKKASNPGSRRQTGLTLPGDNMANETKYNLPRVMTVKELSEYLRVRPSTIYKLLRRGELPGFLDRHRLAFQRRGDRPMVLRAQHESAGRQHQPATTDALNHFSRIWPRRVQNARQRVNLVNGELRASIEARISASLVASRPSIARLTWGTRTTSASTNRSDDFLQRARTRRRLRSRCAGAARSIRC